MHFAYRYREKGKVNAVHTNEMHITRVHVHSAPSTVIVMRNKMQAWIMDSDKFS